MKALLIIEGALTAKFRHWTWPLRTRFSTYQQISIPALPQVGQKICVNHSSRGGKSMEVRSVEFDLAICSGLHSVDILAMVELQKMFVSNEGSYSPQHATPVITCWAGKFEIGTPEIDILRDQRGVYRTLTYLKDAAKVVYYGSPQVTLFDKDVERILRLMVVRFGWD